MVAAGMLFATSAGVAGGTSLRSDTSDLPGLVRSEVARLEQTQQRVVGLQAEVEQLTSKVNNPQVRNLQDQSSKLVGPAQLEPVVGPGLEVVLNDAPQDGPIPEGITPDDLVVHQQDLQAVVNALWAAGAEAMMLMDQRVISTSAVRCVGSTLRLQGQVYSPPYVIKAIGSPSKLKQALDQSPEVSIYREYVRAVGLGYKVTEQRSIRMPAFSGALDLKYAKVPEHG
jgi:uncharacterized protein YlxW (UPF0749 family)